MSNQSPLEAHHEALTALHVAISAKQIVGGKTTTIEKTIDTIVDAIAAEYANQV